MSPWFFINKRKIETKWKRELFEDVLKILYAESQTSDGATAELLAKKLRISSRRANQLIQTLLKKGLATKNEEKIQLTSAGKALGLHLVRAHRLYERYLADDTGVPLRDIHRLADRKEHQLTESEVQSLEARLGFPASDPHGDWIPNERGEPRVTEEKPIPLNRWSPGKPARIVHIEDEPESTFVQILSVGLLPGTDILVQEISERGIHITVDGNEIWLAPALAGQIEVNTPSPMKQSLWLRAKTLSQLQPGEKGRVLAIAHSVRGLPRRRLLDLGFTPGARVECALKSTFGKGDPSAYRIRGTVVALRREQTEQIFIEPVE